MRLVCRYRLGPGSPARLVMSALATHDRRVHLVFRGDKARDLPGFLDLGLLGGQLVEAGVKRLTSQADGAGLTDEKQALLTRLLGC